VSPAFPCSSAAQGYSPVKQAYARMIQFWEFLRQHQTKETDDSISLKSEVFWLGYITQRQPLYIRSHYKNLYRLIFDAPDSMGIILGNPGVGMWILAT
jgi:hypothetical protein